MQWLSVWGYIAHNQFASQTEWKEHPMKPLHAVVVALIFTVGMPTYAFSQTAQKKVTKTETATKRKKSTKKGVIEKSRKANVSSIQSSLTNNTSSRPSSPPRVKDLVGEPTDTRNRVEYSRPIVLRDLKSPGLALGLSALLPGAGQYYNGEYIKGMMQTGVFVTGVVLALTAGTENSYSSHAYTDYSYYGTYTYYRSNTEEETSEWLYIGIGVAAGAWLWSVIDAPLSANSYNDVAARSSYGHMIELNESAYVVGIDVATTLEAGTGVNVAIHF